MYRLLFILIILMLMSFQCAKDMDDPILSQDYLFAAVYSNFAWGKEIKGWYIDNSGLVRGFTASRNPAFIWNPAKEGGFIREEQLIQNFIQADTAYFRIELPELFYYYEHIDPASRGALMEKPVGADLGQLSYYCFTYDSSLQSYRFITLKSEGDWNIMNTSESAEVIRRWLSGINERTELAN